MTSDVLAAMKSLPFPCYSWPVTDIGDNAPSFDYSNMLISWVRVTHSWSLRGETCTEEEVRWAADICRDVNRFNPDIEATLAVNWSPYKGATYEPTEWSQDVFDDIFAYVDKLILIRKWAVNVTVSAVLLDHEHWKVSDGSLGSPEGDAWKTALNQKYDVFYNFAKRVCLEASVFLFGRGATGQHLTGNEQGDGTSTRLYYPDDLSKTLNHISGHRANLEHRAKYGPMISWYLAGGWSRNHFDGNAKPEDRILPAEYSLDNDRAIGKAIAENAPHEPVILYPSPWDPRLTDAWDHFAAFVEGATS